MISTSRSLEKMRTIEKTHTIDEGGERELRQSMTQPKRRNNMLNNSVERMTTGERNEGIGKSSSIVEMRNSMAVKKFAASNKNVRNSLNATQSFL